MCDGQYQPMQNYLREQPDNIKTINLVSEVCTFLQSFYVDAKKDNIFLINQVFKTLIELSVVSKPITIIIDIFFKNYFVLLGQFCQFANPF